MAVDPGNVGSRPFFGPVTSAAYVSRPNRFTVVARLEGRTVRAYLPNPGRLMELLVPGAVLYLGCGRARAGKSSYTCVAVERDGLPVMLDTHRTNDVARYLIDRGLVPGLEEARVVKTDVRDGRSRFDEEQARDRGAYLIVMELGRNRRIRVGELGRVCFRKGFYVYVGSAMKNLTQRIERHRRRRKKLFWHVDYLRAAAGFRAALPVRASQRLECDIARSLKSMADWEIKGFGSSDCGCGSHLFAMETDPLRSARFHDMLRHYRTASLADARKEKARR
jgi:Uri superfamily endonuclease